MATLFLSLTATPGMAQESDPTRGVNWYVDAAGHGLGTGTSVDPFTNIAYGVSRSFVVTGDTFTVAPGTYEDEEIEFFGKSLTIRSTGGPSTTTIVARPAIVPNLPHSAIRVHAGEANVVIEGFRITGGTGALECAGFTRIVGGAVSICADSTLTLRDCSFDTNTSERGGAIYAHEATLNIEDCYFTGPGTEARGEAVYLSSSTATITDSTFEHLFLVSPSIPRGGGALVADNSTLLLQGCSFEHNATRFFGAHLWSRSGDVTVNQCLFGASTGYAGASISASGGTLRIIDSSIQFARAIQAPGAGVFSSNADVLVDQCLFEGNVVDGTREGGAIAMQSGRLTVTDTIFRRNRAGQGGAIATSQSTNTLIRDCQFDGNSGTSGGGAFYSGDSFATIEHSTFIRNTALPSGAGGAVHGRAALRFCSLTDNRSGTDGGAAAGAAHLFRTIAWGNGPTDLVSTATAEESLVGTLGGAVVTDCVDGDPRFWSDQDLHLMPGSAAIDAAPQDSKLDPDGSRGEFGAFTFAPDYCPVLDCHADIGTTSCISQPNSTGEIAGLRALGSHLIDSDRLVLLSTGMPPSVPTLMLASQSGGHLVVPNMLGPLCLGPPFLRLISLAASSRPDGTAPTWVELRAPGGTPGAGLGVQPGETWHFQLWYRDASGGAVTNTTNALRVTLH